MSGQNRHIICGTLWPSPAYPARLSYQGEQVVRKLWTEPKFAHT